MNSDDYDKILYPPTSVQIEDELYFQQMGR
jgi:hypothetical protein